MGHSFCKGSSLNLLSLTVHINKQTVNIKPLEKDRIKIELFQYLCRTLDMRGCMLLILELRQELDGVLLPVNSKLRLLEKNSIANFGGATYTSSSLN